MAIHPSEKNTKANNNGFEDSDVIGVYVTESDSPLQLGGNEINNSEMKFNGSAWIPTSMAYWDKDKTYDAFAYYPYINNISSIEEQPFSIMTEQDLNDSDMDKDGYELSDFLWVNAENIKSGSDAVKLQFSHIMSALKIEVVTTSDYEGELPNDDEIEVYIHNTVLDATVNLSNGDVTKNTYKREKTIKAKSLGNKTFVAIVVPQRLEKKVPLVEVVMKDVSYIWESYFTFKSGMMHTMRVQISKNPENNDIGIDIGGSTEGWE
jgi:hypothetical protein